mgnify:CR=1 FL=1
MIRALLLAIPLAGCGPYAAINVETSDRPPMDIPVRQEIGLTHGPADAYIYHRSDADNGFDKEPYESENGVGIRMRWKP